MREFTMIVLDTINAIPKGKVMTYGQIAAYSGNPRDARGVSRILHSMSDAYNLPWHRVINAKGSISLTGDLGALQAELLRQENVVIEGKKIDLKQYLFRP